MKIKKESTIGLIIDFQERIVPAMSNQEQLINSTKKLISGLQILSVPLIATQQYTRGLGETISDISTLINDFGPIEKKTFSCYDEPLFLEALEKSEAKNVIICGIESHVCVLQTAVDLKDAGYNPIIVLDCVSSRSIESVNIALDRFRFEGIMVTSFESVLFELTASAGAPEFKSISSLVK